MRLSALVLVLALTVSRGICGVPDTSPSVAAYRIDATFLPETGRLEARADVRFQEPASLPDPLVFYLHGELGVERVRSGERELAFSESKVFYAYDYSLVATRVEVGRGGAPVAELSVTYSGPFNPSRARSPSDYMRIDSSGVLLRSYGYSLWFPVFAETGAGRRLAADFTSVTLRTPKEFTAVFVGERLKEEVVGETRVSEWSAPGVELFQAQCTARRFVVTQAGRTFLYHEADEASRAAASGLARFAARLEELYGKRYRSDVVTKQVHLMQMPPYGDISSGNVTGVTSGIWLGIEKDPSAKRALGHELVHPFVGADTPRSDPLYALAIEGFPSYLHLPVLAEIEGESFHDDFLRRVERWYLERRTGKVSWGAQVPPEKPLLAITADEIGVYKDDIGLGDRALLFFCWLRDRTGTERFFELVRALLAQKPLDKESFFRVVLSFLPDAGPDLTLWLETTEYPDRLRLPRKQP